MKKLILTLMLPVLLFADQLVLYKTNGSTQRFELTPLTITFPTENTISLNSTVMDMSTISRVELTYGAVPVQNTDKIDPPRDFTASIDNGYFNLCIKNEGSYSISLYDAMGKHIKVIANDVILKVGDNKFYMNKESLASGIYYLIVKGNKNYTYQWRF